MTNFLKTKTVKQRKASEGDKQTIRKSEMLALRRRYQVEQRVKNINLCKGQYFGEDNFLEYIRTYQTDKILFEKESRRLMQNVQKDVSQRVKKKYVEENYEESSQMDMYNKAYTVVCQSMDSLILVAKVADIARTLKNEVKIIEHMKNQL